jgi:hypothetical protein
MTVRWRSPRPYLRPACTARQTPSGQDGDENTQSIAGCRHGCAVVAAANREQADLGRGSTEHLAEPLEQVGHAAPPGCPSGPWSTATTLRPKSCLMQNSSSSAYRRAVRLHQREPRLTDPLKASTSRANMMWTENFLPWAMVRRDRGVVAGVGGPFDSAVRNPSSTHFYRVS